MFSLKPVAERTLLNYARSFFYMQNGNGIHMHKLIKPRHGDYKKNLTIWSILCFFRHRKKGNLTLWLEFRKYLSHVS